MICMNHKQMIKKINYFLSKNKKYIWRQKLDYTIKKYGKFIFEFLHTDACISNFAESCGLNHKKQTYKKQKTQSEKPCYY